MALFSCIVDRGVPAFEQISTGSQVIRMVWYIFFGKEMYWQGAVYFPLVDQIVQKLNDRPLWQENRFIGQYIVPAKLNSFNSGVQDKLYETYKTDLSEKRDFDNEILRWQTKWSHLSDKKPVTPTKTLQHANPDLYPNAVAIITILLTMPVSTATPERSFSTMRRVKTYLHSTMETEWLAAHTLIYACRDIPIDVEAVIREFCAKKNRRLAFEFLWVPPRFQICLQLMCR